MFERVKALLIDDCHRFWKLWSVQISALGLVLMGIVEVLKDSVGLVPPALVDKLPHGEMIATVSFVLSLVARLIKQPVKAE